MLLLIKQRGLIYATAFASCCNLYLERRPPVLLAGELRAKLITVRQEEEDLVHTPGPSKVPFKAGKQSPVQRIRDLNAPFCLYFC